MDSLGLTPPPVTSAAPSGPAGGDLTGTYPNPTLAIAYIPLSQKAVANGVASLDSGGMIPVGQLPIDVMEYKGTYDANTNTPSLSNGAGSAGDVYLVSVAGTRDFGAGNITFAVGDWVVYSGAIYQKVINTNLITSVFSRTGDVTAQSGDYSEAQISFTDITTNDVSNSKHGYVPKAIDDTDKFLRSDGSWADAPGSGGVTPTIPFDFAQVTSGGDPITLSSNVFADVDNNLDLSIAAVAGDILEFSLSANGKPSSGSDATFDVKLVTSSNHIGGTGGVPGWYIPNLTVSSISLTGSMYYVVQSGDISAGAVAARLRYIGRGSLAAGVSRSTTNPISFWVKNLGQ